MYEDITERPYNNNVLSEYSTCTSPKNMPIKIREESESLIYKNFILIL